MKEECALAHSFFDVEIYDIVMTMSLFYIIK